MNSKKMFLLMVLCVLSVIFAMSASATVNLLAPADNAWVNYNMSAGLNFTYNYTGIEATVNCSLKIDGLFANLSYSINNNTQFNASNSSFPLASGAHNWNVSCRNATGGYMENSTTRILNYDPLSMGIYLNSPADTARNNTGNITVSFSFIDTLSPNASCVLYLNGAAAATNASTQNDTNTIITAVATNGTKVWQVNCTDLAGNINASSAYTYYEDTTTPTVNLIRPTSGAVNNTANITVLFNFTDSFSQNASCTLFLDGAQATYNLTTQNDTNTILNATVLNGTHIWQVNCTDSGSNLGASSVYNYIEDTVAPTLYLVKPADTAWNNTGNISVQFNFTDPGSQNATCFLYLNGAQAATNSTTQNNTNTILTAVVTNGTKTWQVNCTDLAGYVGASSAYTYYEDTTTPTVYLNNLPADYAINTTGKINTSFNFTDAYSQNASCTLYLDGAALETNATTQNDTNTVLSGAVGNGTHVWQVNCTDSGSNLGASSARTYIVDNVAPAVYLTTPTNSYYNNSATPAFTFSIIDAGSLNASCTLYINGTAYGTNSAVNNKTNTSITANHSLTNGIYTWQVNCTDLAGYVGNSSNYILITDLTNPAAGIAWVNDLTASADGTTNNTLRINFTMSDTNFKNWTLRVYNSTPVMVATWNDTVNNNSKVLSYAAVSNGTYYINLTVWDNSSRVNTATLFTIYVDNINPTLVPTNVSNFATTSITLTTSASDSIDGVSTIDFCNYSGAGSGNFTLAAGLYIANLSGLTANTQYTANVSCYDIAGNTNSTLVTFTTYAGSSSSSSSSSGGGGNTGSTGGVPTTVLGQFEQKTWISINAGETATVPIANGEIGVTEVSFGVTSTIWGPWLKVEKEATKPSETTKFSNNVYKYVEITKGPALKDNLIKDAKISFKVEKTWLNTNTINKANVGLYRYVGTKWTELKTTLTTEDTKYVHYTAETPGFSYFLIGQKATVAAPAAPVTEAETPAAVTTPAPEAAPEEAAPEEASAVKEALIWPWVVLVIVIIAIIVAAMYWKKK